MQTKPTKPRAKYNGTGIKFFISSLSLAATIGFWNMFSSRDNSAALINQEKMNTTQVPPANSFSLPPLPTLVPITASLAADSPLPAENRQPFQKPIRSVGKPVAQPAVNNSTRSLFEFVFNPSVDNGGDPSAPNGGGGTTSTGSSR